MTADEYIAERERREQEQARRDVVQHYYRWWTVSAGRDHVKLGPVSVCWYRWGVEVIALCRYPLLRVGGGLF